jgi:hypothetical protein
MRLSTVVSCRSAQKCEIVHFEWFSISPERAKSQVKRRKYSPT